jgi:site-specific DNA recombinase
MRKADLYIRVSTDEQADKGYSQRDQEERLKRYCEIKGYLVRNVYIEDFSAKTFNRPEWKKLITGLRKNRSRTDISLLLFTKWDRFSRNVSQAYQSIDLIRSLNADPQAIEQPLDMSIPESKIMLSHYLTIPEVENDRRALNVFYGMRRAKKEGRWMGTAPLGYKNKITEAQKKYIAEHEIEGPILRWAFDEIAKNNYNTEQIWNMTRTKAKGIGRFSKNNFWVALRNPLYCGKILIPPFKDETGYFVKGQHEPLVSESLFYDVQDVLDGRKRKIKPKIVSLDNLPLRGFLKCPKCGLMLTGSASRGKLGKYYYYYHCSSSCGVRFKAENTNELFVEELQKYIPKPGMIEVYIAAVVQDFKSQTKQQNSERKSILSQIEKIDERMRNARVLRVDGKLDEDDFICLKKESNQKIEQLERDLARLSNTHKEITDLLEIGLKKLAGLDLRYINGTVEEKREIISSMFPENILFDGIEHRTLRVNAVVQLIYLKTNDLERKKKGQRPEISVLSQEVNPQGLEPWTR